MSIVNRIRQRQIVRESEGYLELALLPEDYAAPMTVPRRRLLERTLESLARLPEVGSTAQYLQGLALRFLERYDEAVAPLKAAAEADPADIHLWLALGWCYKRVGRLDLAIDALEEARAVDAAQAIIHYNLACYWSLAGNSQQSLMFLSQALAIDSSYRSMLDSEHDFDNIRSDPGFQALNSVTV